MTDTPQFALIHALAKLAKVLAPEQIIHRYPDLLLIRISDPAGALAEAALELIPADLPLRVNGLRLQVPAGGFAPIETPRAVLRFFGPIAPDWLARLAARGVHAHFRCPRFGLCAALPKDLDVDALRAELPALAGWLPYGFDLCQRALPHPGGPLPDWTDIVCFTDADRAAVADRLAEAAIPVLAQSRYKLRIGGARSLDAVRRLRGVKLADGARAAVLAGAELRLAVGLAPASASTAPTDLDGAGEVIAVADTGLDQGHADGPLHPDFQGRVRALTSWPINPSWDTYVATPGSDDGGADLATGHGTHVAGLALGDGRLSAGRFSGLAPAAQLVFQAMEQYTEVLPEHRHQIPSGWYLNGRPLDLRELFIQAHGLGARIHVNAWGDPAQGRYTDDCFEADLFCRQHPEALVLFAAGNTARATGRTLELDPGSLYAPASAKNVIAIGATEGPSAGIGYRGTWSGFDPDGRRFPNPALAGRPVSGKPEQIALFSSTGPTQDGRIKPDLCAPGTNLVAPKTRAAAARGWGLASPLPHYIYYGGTSMACGVAGGSAALLRQAWTRALTTPPSGPALKALLCYGAAPVIGADGNSPAPPAVAGFGRLDLAASLPGGPNAPVLLDRSLAPDRVGLVSGQILEFELTLAVQARWRAVLCWYDEPGEALINDLDLCLIDPDGNATWGNHPPGAQGQPDHTNTVERIDVAIPRGGTWRLQVIAVNVPHGPQGFALVHGATAETAAAPAHEDQTLPLDWVKGIGKTYSKRLVAAGVPDLPALLSLERQRLAEVLGIGGSRLKRLADRLAQLRAVTPASLAQAPLDLTLEVIRQDRQPVDLDTAAWESLRDAVAPLMDIFDKDIHTQVRITDLHRLVRIIDEPMENTDA